MGNVRRPRGKRARTTLARRWVRNAFALMAALLLLIGGILSWVLRGYYYQSLRSALENRAQLYRRTLELSADAENASTWEKRSRELIAYFTDKDKLELQVLNTGGGILLSSTGFVPVNDPAVAEQAAEAAANGGECYWTGKNGSGERVMALTVIAQDSDGNTIGALRYVTSLRPVTRQITVLTLLVFGIVLLILFFVALSGSYFIRSIVDPVTEIGRTTRRIAMGEYDARLTKEYDDEIGDLCDAINFMAQEIGETERMKNEFLSSVSHELRTPLTAIKGWSETLQSVPDDRELNERGLAVIGREAGRLSGLVEELLDFSRMESGHIVLHRRELDILAELEEAAFLFRDRAARAGMRLEYFGGEDLPPVWGDPDRLRQVFVNLLDNAVKYSRAGDRIRVEAAAMPDGVQIVVSDTGIGIAAEELPRVRQKFYQTDPSNPGSGIGLSLVDEIVRLHGGRLDIDSEPGVGTTVTVTLPAAEKEN